MNIVQRVQDILLKPQATWPVIDQEPGDVAALYKTYLVFLAAIPAVAAFVGLSLIGIGGFGLSIRVPFVSGLVHMVVSYVLSLVLVYVFALVVEALAPTFGGTKNRLAAVRLVAYSMTASFVGGIFALVPSLGVLGLLASVYSIYLLYLGIPVLMKCPPDKAAAYTAVSVVCGIVLGLVVGALSAMTLPTGGFGSLGAASRDSTDVVISTPQGDVKIDTSKMDEMAKKMEEAGKRMEAAQKSGDTEAAGKAFGDIMGAMTGSGGEPIPAQDLKAALPESLAGLARSSVESQSSKAMGMAGSLAKAAYRDGERHVDLSVTDMGGTAGLAALGWAAAVTLDRDADGKVERVYKQGARTVREEFHKDGSRGEYTLILANGLIVEAKGERVAQPALKALVEGLDLAKLESMKRTAKS